MKNELTAVHESGHAIAALALGRKVNMVHVCECGRGFCSYSPAHVDDKDDLVIRVAGSVAAMYKFGPELGGRMSASDRIGFKDLPPTELNRIAQRATELVAQTWDSIEALAAGLAKQGTLEPSRDQEEDAQKRGFAS